MAMNVEPITVTGLKEFQKGLKQVDKDLPKELRKGFNEVADLVVADVRKRVPVRSGKARLSVRSASTQTAAQIKAGGRKAPYYPWLDFGGRVGPNKSVKRPFRQGGRYLYPAIKQNRDEMLEALDDVMVRLFRREGWDG